jgi:hypothetical protein
MESLKFQEEFRIQEFKGFLNIYKGKFLDGYFNLIEQLSIGESMPNYFCFKDFRWYLTDDQCDGKSIMIDNLGIRKMRFHSLYNGEEDPYISYIKYLFQMVKVSAAGDAAGRAYFSIYDIYSGELIYDYDNRILQFQKDMEYYGNMYEDGQVKTMHDWFKLIKYNANPRAVEIYALYKALKTKFITKYAIKENLFNKLLIKAINILS